TVETTHTAAGAARRLRRFAHTLFMTPQFMLAGVPTVDTWPPRLSPADWTAAAVEGYVCQAGEHCTLGAYLTDYQAQLNALGHAGSFAPEYRPFWHLVTSGAPPVTQLRYGAINEGDQATLGTQLTYQYHPGAPAFFAEPPQPYQGEVAYLTPKPFSCDWFSIVVDAPGLVTEADETNNIAVGMQAELTCLPGWYALFLNDLGIAWAAEMGITGPPPPAFEMSYSQFSTFAAVPRQPLFDAWLSAQIAAAGPTVAAQLAGISSDQRVLFFAPDHIEFRANSAY
ncbi:MAG: hypothetical protein KC620_07370, partial [Myxococcales bacterium]|nr:hypothetical protein [Myxococcales bacterium]